MRETTGKDRIEEAQRTLQRAPKGIFYLAESWNCNIEEAPGIKTADTNGTTIRYNPDYLAGKDQPEALAVFVHELIHNLNGDPWNLKRLSKLHDYKLVYQAAEFVTNCQVMASGFGRLPKGCEIPQKHGLPPNMELQWYINALEQKKSEEQNDDEEQGTEGDPSDEPEDSSGDSGAEAEDNETDDAERSDGDDGDEQSEGSGDSEHGGGTDDGDAGGRPSDFDPEKEFDEGFIDDLREPEDDGPEAELQNMQSFMNAVQAATAAGSVPGWAAQRVLRIERLSKTDFRHRMKRFLSPTPEGATWNRPNRRYLSMWPHTPMAGRGTGQSIKTVAVGVDVSGSTQGERTKFLSNLAKFGQQFQNTKIVYFEWNTLVYEESIEEFDGSQVPRVREDSRSGGTMVAPVFEWYEKERKKRDFAGLMLFTDGEFDDLPERKPKYPVLWCIAGMYSREPEWGETCFIEE